MALTTQNPFLTHYDTILGPGEPAKHMRDLVRDMGGQSLHPVNYSDLFGQGEQYTAIALELISWFSKSGRGDRSFNALLSEILDYRESTRNSLQERMLAELKHCHKELEEQARRSRDRAEIISLASDLA